MEISKTLESKQKKLYLKKKNIEYFDGGLGENPLPKPILFNDILKKYKDKIENIETDVIDSLKNKFGNNLIG